MGEGMPSGFEGAFASLLADSGFLDVQHDLLGGPDGQVGVLTTLLAINVACRNGGPAYSTRAYDAEHRGVFSNRVERTGTLDGARAAHDRMVAQVRMEGLPDRGVDDV